VDLAPNTRATKLMLSKAPFNHLLGCEEEPLGPLMPGSLVRGGDGHRLGLVSGLGLTSLDSRPLVSLWLLGKKGGTLSWALQCMSKVDVRLHAALT
jgi:hypothetical protein